MDEWMTRECFFRFVNVVVVVVVDGDKEEAGATTTTRETDTESILFPRRCLDPPADRRTDWRALTKTPTRGSGSMPIEAP